MKGFRKRIVCVFCAVIIATSSLFSCPLRVQATSVAVPVIEEVAGKELLMMVLELLLSGLVVGGMSEYEADYDVEMNLLQSYMDYVMTGGEDGSWVSPNMLQLQLEGSTGLLNIADCINSYVDGTGALALPDEDFWSKYRVVEGGGGSGDEDPEEDPEDPEPEDVKLFSMWDMAVINTAMFASIGDFIGEIFAGEISAVPPETFFDIEQSGFSGEFEIDETGNYILQGKAYHTQYLSTSLYRFVETSFDTTNTVPVAGFFSQATPGTDGTATHSISFYQYNGKISVYYMPQTILQYSNNGSLYNSSTKSSYVLYFSQSLLEEIKFNINIPIFESYEALENYFLTGDLTGLLNGECYDFPALIQSIPERFSPLAGLALDPASLADLNAALSTAVQPYPLPDIDPAENTQQYQETTEEVITTFVSTLPEPEPDPVPDPEPEPDPVTPGEDTELDYQVNLTNIFPFCLPFDFIALLQALDAEPETPKFEVPFIVPAMDYETTICIDLAFLDDVMENLRKIELGGFIIFLIFATGKLIKW